MSKDPHSLENSLPILQSEGNLKYLITKEVNQLTNSFEEVNNTTDEILQKLFKSIGEIDFMLLAFPECENITQQIKDLEPFVFNEDGSLKNENKKEGKQYYQLKKELESYRLSKNHYLILVIEKLHKIAFTNHWGLCKKNGFIYLYNGSYWNQIDKDSFQFFLGNVALQMGVEKFKGKIHTFKEDLLSNLWQTLICRHLKVRRIVF